MPESPARPRADATEELLRKVASGDQDAYDRLFAHAAERVLLFIRIRLGKGLQRKLEPMDVLQETHLAAHRVFSNFEYRHQRSFTHWLCRIADNCLHGLADYHGARKRRPPGALERISRMLDRLGDGKTGPATSVERRDERERLAEAMGKLAQDERTVLLSRFFQEKTMEELAHELGRSPSAAQRLLARATSRLGEIMKGC